MNLIHQSSQSIEAHRIEQPFGSQWSLLLWLSERPDYEFMSLFRDTRNACEKEVLVWQTIKVMAHQYKKAIAEGNNNPLIASKVALNPDDSLINNSGAYRYLIENGYLAESDGHCAITQKVLAKLVGHFADKVPATPLPLPKEVTKQLPA